MAPRLGRFSAALSTGQETREDAHLLGDYVRAARLFRKQLLAVLLAAMLPAAMLLFATRHHYTATAKFTIVPTQLLQTKESDRLIWWVSIDTEVAALRSLEVAEPVAKQLGLTTAQVQDSIVITVPPLKKDKKATPTPTQTGPDGKVIKKSADVPRLMNISFKSSTPQLAINGANAVAKEYLKQRTAINEERKALLVTRMAKSVEVADKVLAQAKANLAAAKTPEAKEVAADFLETQTTTSNPRWHTRLTDLQALPVPPGTLDEEATQARGPKITNQIAVVASFLALGLVTFVLLLPVFRRQRKVTSTKDAFLVADVYHALPAPPALRTRDRDALAAYLQMWSLVLKSNRPTPRVLGVLPVDQLGAGREVSVDLAAASAGQGVRTALVVPGHPPWAVLQALGMEHIEAPESSADEALHILGPSPRFPNLALATIGHPIGMPYREGMEAAIAMLSDSFEHIVLLAPPPGTIEHYTVAWMASVPLFVSGIGESRIDALAHAVAVARANGSAPAWALVAGDAALDQPPRLRRLPRRAQAAADAPSRLGPRSNPPSVPPRDNGRGRAEVLPSGLRGGMRAPAPLTPPPGGPAMSPPSGPVAPPAGAAGPSGGARGPVGFPAASLLPGVPDPAAEPFGALPESPAPRRGRRQSKR